MAEPQQLTIPPRLATRLAQYATDADVDVAGTETPEEAEARHTQANAHRLARWEQRRPLIYADANPHDIEGHSDVVAWLGTDRLTLVLAGPVGVGKTHAAYAIGNQAVTLGLWVEAWSVTDLLEALRPNGDGAPGIRDCDLLVLDDLGAQRPSDWAIETMTALVDARIREGRRQVVTTNAPYDALLAAWDGRLLDRLAFRWVPVTMRGESRRRAAW